MSKPRKVLPPGKWARAAATVPAHKPRKVLPAVFDRRAIFVMRSAGYVGEIALVVSDKVIIVPAVAERKQTRAPLTEARVRELIRQELLKPKKTAQTRPPERLPYSEPTFAYGTPFTRKRKRPLPASEPIAVYGAPFTRKRKKTW